MRRNDYHIASIAYYTVKPVNARARHPLCLVVRDAFLSPSVHFTYFSFYTQLYFHYFSPWSSSTRLMDNPHINGVSNHKLKALQLISVRPLFIRSLRNNTILLVFFLWLLIFLCFCKWLHPILRYLLDFYFIYNLKFINAKGKEKLLSFDILFKKEKTLWAILSSLVCWAHY